MTSTLVILAVAVSACFYLGMGLRRSRQMHNVGDLLPIKRGSGASVETAGEFSASTIATTISLATVLLALFELAPYMGPWLLWTTFTTALGLVVVKVMSGKILTRLETYEDRIPTIHDFLKTEYNSTTLGLVGAFCTSLGFLGAFAVELTVSARFFSALVPDVPVWVAVVVFAFVAVTYTSAGGFRTVIRTDVIQVLGIWVLLATLLICLAVYIWPRPGWSESIAKVPAEMVTFSNRDGLIPFLLGIFFINVPTYVCDMSVWQRLTSLQSPKDAAAGLSRSIIGTAALWGTFAVIACLAPIIVGMDGSINPLVAIVNKVGSSSGVLPAMAVFLIATGLFAAMLSTASTQLIAMSHVIYEDVLHMSSKRNDLFAPRVILIFAAFAATVVVEILNSVGFTVADFVFSIFGSQLGLFPPVFVALYFPKWTQRMGFAAACGAITGFLAGWTAATVGKVTGDGNLVFLSPVVSLATSVVVMFVMSFVSKKRHSND